MKKIQAFRFLVNNLAMSSASTANPTFAAQAFVNKFNEDYETKHLKFEEQFWGTKMDLSSTSEVTFSAEDLTKTKNAMEDLLSDYKTVEEAKKFKESLPDSAPQDLIDCLDIIIRTCECYATSPENKEVREKTSMMESGLELKRNRMELGYKDAEGNFVKASSVGLRNMLQTNEDEAMRKAAYEGLRSIGPFICENGFVEIVKLRNKVAKSKGFVDYYDYQVTNSEGMSKAKLFEIMDGLEEGTRPIMEASLKELEKRHGVDALKPWNTSFKLAGSLVQKMVRSTIHIFGGSPRSPLTHIDSSSHLKS